MWFRNELSSLAEVSLYITKWSICVSTIYRYSQLFNVVFSCHAADVPSVSDSCPHVWSQRLLLSMAVVLPNLQEEVEKTLSLTSPPTWKSPGVLNQAIVAAKLSIHHVQSNQPSCRTGRICKQLCTSEMPSGGLNEKSRTGRNFWKVRNWIVTSSSAVMRADFCVTSLGKPCVSSSLKSAAGVCYSFVCCC